VTGLFPNLDPEHTAHLLDAYRAHRLVHGVASADAASVAGQWQLVPGQVPSQNEADIMKPSEDVDKEGLCSSMRNPCLVVSGMSNCAGFICSRTVRHHASPHTPGQAVHECLKNQTAQTSSAADVSLVWASSADYGSISTAAPPSSMEASMPKTPDRVGSWISEEQVVDDSCGVCLDDKGDIVATQPCGHKMCVDCAMELLKLHAYDPSPCPFCRSMIRGFKG